MRTGRYRFVERQRFLRAPLQVLEVEHEEPSDSQINRALVWRPGTASDAVTILSMVRVFTRGRA